MSAAQNADSVPEIAVQRTSPDSYHVINWSTKREVARIDRSTESTDAEWKAVGALLRRLDDATVEQGWMLADEEQNDGSVRS